MATAVLGCEATSMGMPRDHSDSSTSLKAIFDVALAALKAMQYLAIHSLAAGSSATSAGPKYHTNVEVTSASGLTRGFHSDQEATLDRFTTTFVHLAHAAESTSPTQAEMLLESRELILAYATGGLAAHAIFNRRETNVKQFLAVTAALFAIPVTVLHAPVAIATRAVGAFLATLVGSILFYRLVSPYHPLAKVPGPVLSRATQLSLFRSVWRGQTRKDMQKLHQRYGPIVRIGPNEVSIADIDAILVIHGAKSWVKGRSYDVAITSNPRPEDTSMIALRTHQGHAARRRIWDKAFAMDSLRDYQLVIHSRIGQLTAQFDKRIGETVNLYKWIGFLTWDVMTDLAYGGGDKIVSGTDTGSTIASLHHIIHISGIGKSLPWAAPYLKALPSGLPPMRGNAAKMFGNRLENGRQGETRDVFYYLLGEEKGAGKNGNGLSRAALAADSALVISAGADTSSLVMSLIFFSLLREPHHYKKLQAYIDEALGEDEFPTNEALMHLPTLEAYISEALRLYSPVPFANQREAPQGGAMIAGHFIPEGVQARMATYAMHRNPEWFGDPDAFRPERWLPDSGFKGPHEKKAFFPFLHGPYHCVGRNFALQQMRMLIATALRRYDMRFAQDFDADRWLAAVQDRGQLEIRQPLSVVMTLRDSKAKSK